MSTKQDLDANPPPYDGHQTVVQQQQPSCQQRCSYRQGGFNQVVPEFKHKAAFILGICQILFSPLVVCPPLVSFGVLKLGKFWAITWYFFYAISYICAGIVGILASRKKLKSYILAYLIMSAVAWGVSISPIITIIITLSKPSVSEAGYFGDWHNGKTVSTAVGVVIHVVCLLGFIIEVGLGIGAHVITSRILWCSKRKCQAKTENTVAPSGVAPSGDPAAYPNSNQLYPAVPPPNDNFKTNYGNTTTSY